MEKKTRPGRVPVKCSSCGSVFNKDYQKIHEKTIHGGNSVKIKRVGVPENPFTLAATQKKRERESIPSTSKEHASGSGYKEGNDLMAAAMGDEITAQLAAAGPVGVAAAAAIVSSKNRKRPHPFETHPSIRKMHQNRLLRKLREVIDEFTTRVGQQAIVLVATPSKPNTSCKVFGTKPLEDVIKNLSRTIMEDLENALAQQAPPPVQEDPTLFELPPLISDGIPTPVEKMTQAQLRAFIPLMLKYSNNRPRPGWGIESKRPSWWPKNIPWANIKTDTRSEQEKPKISWTGALRQIVINCYKYHGREDLLPKFTFTETNKKANPSAAKISSSVAVLKKHSSGMVPRHKMQISGSSKRSCFPGGYSSDTHITPKYTPTVPHMITNPDDGTVSNVQAYPNNPIITLPDVTTTEVLEMATITPNYITVTVTNPDGTVSIGEPNDLIITLPDGTTAQVLGMSTVQSTQGDGSQVHAIQTITEGGAAGEVIDMNSVTEATLDSEGQIILTAEDGHVSGVITIAFTASMYQTMVANIQHLHTNSDGTVCVTPVVQVPKIEPNSDDDMDTFNVTPSDITTHSMMIQGSGGEAPQVLPVLSLKDATVLTEAMEGIDDIKIEETILSYQ